MDFDNHYSGGECLYQSSSSKIFRAIDHETNKSVIIKIHTNEYPSPRARNRYMKEYDIGCMLNKSSQVIRYKKLRKYGRRLALVMEDCGGILLETYLRRTTRMKIRTFLHIAIQLAEGMMSINEHMYMYQTLIPRHILINPETDQIRFFNLEYCSLLNRQYVQMVKPKRSDKHLAYISPEQTSRMNKEVDYRANFYSLGVLFYRMLCGSLPFSGTDPARLIYSHIAKAPMAPHELDKEIPRVISDIISRLLAKNADDRYQSTYGLMKDLKRCLNEIDQTGKISNFVIGVHDINATFRIRQKLYGREEDRSRLLGTLADIASGEPYSNLVIVHGYSGIGKSSLINEMHEHVAKYKGYFISGKFDQFKRNIPYSSLIQAFRQLILTILTQPEDKIISWKNKLKQALGMSGKVITDVIPEVEILIGPQEQVAELGPSENENRFKKVFSDFIATFASKSHPLVLFLDDVQWGDLPTLSLLESIVKSDIPYLLLILAYRDNEVASGFHPLPSIISRIEKDRSILSIPLEPLNITHITQLICDSLSCDPLRCQELAQLVFQKTQGNPFFVVVFLNNLWNEGMLYFDASQGRWCWDTEQLNVKIADNVADMLTERIQKLEKDTQTILSLGACIGNLFDLQSVSLISHKTMQEVGRLLTTAVQDGLLFQFGEEHDFNSMDTDLSGDNITYQFMHDRIQQSAYQLVDMENRGSLHLNIGRMLLASVTEDAKDETIFDILSHFKHSSDLIVDPEEKVRLGNLFLQASRRAKDASAYDPACEYARIGISMLSDSYWNTSYDLCIQLHKQLIECGYLSGNFDLAESLYPKVLKNCKHYRDTIEVKLIQAGQYESQQRYVDVIDVLRECLSHFSIILPKNAEEQQELWNLKEAEIEINLSGKNIQDLINNCQMTDPDHILAFKLLITLWAPLYCIGEFMMLGLVSTLAVNYTLKYGNCSLSSSAYILYSFSTGHTYKDYKKAYEWGLLGMRIQDQYKHTPLGCRNCFVFGLGINHFTKPLTKGIPYVDKAWELALLHGDLPYAAYTSHFLVSHRYLSGMNLQELQDNYSQYLLFLKKTNPFIYCYGYSSTMPVRYHLGIEDLNEEEYITNNKDFYLNMGGYYAGKLICLYWEGKDWDKLMEISELMISTYANAFYGQYILEECKFISAMVFMNALSMNIISEETYREKYESLVDSVFLNFEQTTASCPSNNLHKLQIMKGEKARIHNDIVEAIRFYDQARQSAANAGFIQYEALANELAAKLWYEQRLEKYAKTHIREAYYLYSEWGSRLKMKQLKAQYPGTISDIETPNSSPCDSDDSWDKQWDSVYGSDAVALEAVDYLAVMKASKALSSEMNLDELLDNMMKTIIEFSGAQKGVLLLTGTDGLDFLVVAEGNSDRVVVDTIRAIPLSSCDSCPKSVINYVARTKETVIISDSTNRSQFESDPVFESNNIKSVLCAPIIKLQKLKGIIYLENNLVSDAFQKKRADSVRTLASHMTMHLENAKFSALLDSERRYRLLAAELEIVKKRLEEFIDVLCHELRNPLSGLYSSNSAMKEVLDQLNIFFKDSNYTIESNDANKKQFVKTILEDFQEMLSAFSISSEHLKDIVDTVLTVSMLENQSVKLQSLPFNPRELLNNVAVMFQAKMSEKRLALITDFPDEEFVVIGDPYRFKEVIINLLSNAIKFTEQGHIILRYRCLNKSSTHSELRFEIEDTGIGLDRIEQGKLFRAFSQANSQTYAKYGGSGLGLKISKQIIELMGGSINVQSEKDRGSTFVFDLKLENCIDGYLTPVDQDTPHPTTIHSQVSDESTRMNSGNVIPCSQSNSNIEKLAETHEKKQQLHVLIAEDSIINSKLLRRLIQNAGFTCEVANNGLEAVHLYNSSSQIFDVILMDIEMPVMSGLDATVAIREREKQISINRPVVIIGVSANARSELVGAALAAGMQDFVTKPYHAKDILDTINKCINTGYSEA